MISISRPNPAPDVLQVSGPPETAANLALYNADKAGFASGRKFTFLSSIYNAKEVKKSLIKCQHDKCCFCESKISHISYGDIEHFRPKAGYKQGTTGALQRPGYFWLAYEWTNLLFCCQICNQREKGNHFPLADAAKRARAPDGKIDDEQPMFINPAIENPELSIGFRGDTPFALGGNNRGTVTISALGLRRKALRDRRTDLLEKLKLIYLVARVTPVTPYQQAAENLLQRAGLENAEYSAAVRSAISDGFQFV